MHWGVKKSTSRRRWPIDPSQHEHEYQHDILVYFRAHCFHTHRFHPITLGT